jgi:anti-sigma regulatory factor (Ser/Thr protein kinase)
VIGNHEAEPISAGDGFELRITARPENLRRVRRAFDGLSLPQPLVEDARLLTTELVTNSIRHTGLGPHDDIRVKVEWTGTSLRVAVHDTGPGAPSSPIAGSIRPDPGARSGWGLHLVDRLASRWGTTFENGTEFWFELEARSDVTG